jgi:hypothetical protein
MAHKLVQHNIKTRLKFRGFLSLSAYAINRSRIVSAYCSYKPCNPVIINSKAIKLSAICCQLPGMWKIFFGTNIKKVTLLKLALHDNLVCTVDRLRDTLPENRTSIPRKGTSVISFVHPTSHPVNTGCPLSQEVQHLRSETNNEPPSSANV